MGPEDADFDFLDNPVVALISNAIDIRLAWSREPILLGQGAHLSGTSITSYPVKPSPFAINDLASTKLIYLEETSAEYKEESTSGLRSSEEHLSIGLGVAVGPPCLGRFANAGVRGQYDRTVTENSDSGKSSIHSTYRVGMITFDTLPQLSASTRESIPPRWGTPAQMGKFDEMYGDYYVSALVLGGDNSVLLSTNSTDKTTHTAYNIQVTAKFLRWEKKVAERKKDELKVETRMKMSVVGFDTLDLQEKLLSYDPFIVSAKSLEMLEEHKRKAKTLEQRISKELTGLGLVHGKEVSIEVCEMLIKRGLVAEILLCPLSRHPQYVEGRNRLP